MGRGTGALSGAASGAQMGSMFGPWGAGIGAGAGAIMGAFTGGESPEERLAKQQQRKQMERSEQFWRQAQGQQGQAEKYFAPIAGGSRTAAMEAMAPEIQGATQRFDAGRRSMLNLSSRSGGAAAMMDPHAKAGIATSMLQKARPMAANAMAQMAGQTGDWAQSQGGAGRDMMDYAMQKKKEEAAQGASFYDSLSGVMQTGKDQGWFKKGTGGGGGGSSWINPFTGQQPYK